MNKAIPHYVSELLFLHDCVIIPEFGGFVGSRKSAELNKFTGTLSPPSKQILFNPNLKSNDGLLIAHIANKEGITTENVKNKIIKFVNKINTKLNTSKVLRLDKVGLFTMGKEGNIIFLQDSSINYNLDTFGMTPTYNKTIVRKIEAKKQINTAVHKIKIPNKTSKYLLRAVAVLIPLIALSYLSISKQEKINHVYTQMASLNLFSSNSTNSEKAITVPAKTIIKENVNTVKKTDVVKKTLPIVTQKKYYVIAGSFTVQKNANKMLAKLKRWDYNSEIVKGKKLLRVSYDSFDKREDAVLVLNKIKQENPDAWLLTK